MPRYNEFRRRVFKDPVKKFEDITEDRDIAEELRSVYDNDIESVDLMSGLFAEDLPPGFGFSDTAFRIFSVMAPRRLKSDRFITDSYNADVYTASGIDWIENNNFRHGAKGLAPPPRAAARSGMCLNKTLRKLLFSIQSIPDAV